MVSERIKAIVFWTLCTVVLPVLWLMQLAQALFGSVERSMRMAVAIDACANALLGGKQLTTISARTGEALIEGRRWGVLVAPCIDYLFGKDHCVNEYRKQPLL